MTHLLKVIPFMLLITSCASLNPLDVLNPAKPSLEVSAQVGKTNEQEKNNIKVEDGKTEVKQEADSISNDKNYNADKIENIVQGMSKFELALFTLLAGIAIPSYKVLYDGIKTIISDTFNNVIVYPIKGIAVFILKLLGRK